MMRSRSLVGPAVFIAVLASSCASRTTVTVTAVATPSPTPSVPSPSLSPLPTTPSPLPTPHVSPSPTQSPVDLYASDVEAFGGVHVVRAEEAGSWPVPGIVPWPGHKPAPGYLLHINQPLLTKVDVAHLLDGLHEASKLDGPPHAPLGQFSIAVEDPTGVQMVADEVDLTINRSAGWWINTGLFWFDNGKPMKRPDYASLAGTPQPTPTPVHYREFVDASAHGSGAYAVASASTNIDFVNQLLISVTTSPGNYQVVVSWDLVCGDSTSGQYTATAPDKRIIQQFGRIGSPDCIVSAVAQEQGSGTVYLKIIEADRK
jgi:hypothetical protein